MYVHYTILPYLLNLDRALFAGWWGGGGGNQKSNAIFTVFSVQVTFNNLNMCVLYIYIFE